MNPPALSQARADALASYRRHLENYSQRVLIALKRGHDDDAYRCAIFAGHFALWVLKLEEDIDGSQ